MIHFYFKDRLINDFFYKDVFCVPIELGKQLGDKVELNFVGSDLDLKNPYNSNLMISINIHKNYFFMFIYFLKHIPSISLLGLFHIYRHSIITSFFYKLFNKKGKVYIKGDFNLDSLKNLSNLYQNYPKFIKYILSLFNIISFENENLLNYFKEVITINDTKLKLLLIKNALYVDRTIVPFNPKEKENIILIIGRIYYEKAKNYSFLLKVLSEIEEKLNNWQVLFIGETKGEFGGEYVDFLENNSDTLKKLEEKYVNIKFLGKVLDRRTIYTYLNKSKIFCLSSYSEGDPLVQYEAMYYGNLMVSTNVGTIRNNYYKDFLSFSDVGDFDKYKFNLENAIRFFNGENSDKILSLQNKTHDYCKNNYSWSNNIMELINNLKN